MDLQTLQTEKYLTGCIQDFYILGRVEECRVRTLDLMLIWCREESAVGLRTDHGLHDTSAESVWLVDPE